MLTFTYDPRRCWLWRVVLSRNPLVRGTDRIAALVIMLAVALSLLVIPVAGAVGSAVYDARAHLYAREARTWHRVTATIIGTGGEAVEPYIGRPVMQARWAAEGVSYTAFLPLKDPVKPGDLVQVWVDADGNPVDAPPPTSHAGFEAVNIAISIAILMIGASASLVVVARWQLDRIRDAQAERAIQILVR